MAPAQPFNWQWSVHAPVTTDVPWTEGFATHGDGNSFVAGSFSGEASFGTLPTITSAGDRDIFVARYDAQGQAIWAVSAGGGNADDAYGLALDGNGHIYLTGSFHSPTAQFGDTTLACTGLMDIFVAKLDAATGAFIWAQRYGSNDFLGNTHTERGTAVACDAAGNAYVTGCFRYDMEVPGLPTLEGCSQYYTSFLLKLAPDGTPLWSRRADCGRHWSHAAGEGQAVHVGDDGMLYAGYRVRGDTLFVEGDTLLNMVAHGQTDDAIVIKYDPEGQPQWLRRIGANGYDNVRALQADADGNLYVGIHREGSYGHLGLPNIEWAGPQGTYKCVVLKLDQEGQFVSGARLGNSTYGHDISAMLLEAPDKLLVGGWSRGSFDINGIELPVMGTGLEGLYLARFDADLTYIEGFRQRAFQVREINGIGRDQPGNLYVAGRFRESLELPGLPAMSVGSGNGAVFVARSGDIPTHVDPLGSAAEVWTFPIPTDGPLVMGSDIRFDEVRIMDALGRVVLEERFAPVRQHTFFLRRQGTYTGVILRAGKRVGHCRILVL